MMNSVLVSMAYLIQWPYEMLELHQLIHFLISLSVFLCPLAEFSIWTREAGAGGLSIAVEGPSKAEISFEDRKDGSCGVSYIVKEPGETLAFTQVLRDCVILTCL